MDFDEGSLEGNHFHQYHPQRAKGVPNSPPHQSSMHFERILVTSQGSSPSVRHVNVLRRLDFLDVGLASTLQVQATVHNPLGLQYHSYPRSNRVLGGTTIPSCLQYSLIPSHFPVWSVTPLSAQRFMEINHPEYTTGKIHSLIRP